MMATSYSIISLALLSFFFPNLLTLSAQQPPDDMVYYKCFIANGNYRLTSPYRTNLNKLLSDVTSDPDKNSGFFTSSFGDNPYTVYAQGLCRADADVETCRSCLSNTSVGLKKKCQNQKRAFGYNDYCTLQYSNSKMEGLYMDPSFSYSFNNPVNSADGQSFTSALNDLMQILKSNASDEGNPLKAAVGRKKANDKEIVYGLAQCTPDLSQQDCEDCLQEAISQIPACCGNKIGGRVIKLNCNLRFEKQQFYNM